MCLVKSLDKLSKYPKPNSDLSYWNWQVDRQDMTGFDIDFCNVSQIWKVIKFIDEQEWFPLQFELFHNRSVQWCAENETSYFYPQS